MSWPRGQGCAAGETHPRAWGFELLVYQSWSIGSTTWSEIPWATPVFPVASAPYGMAEEKYVANVVLEGGAEQSKMEKLHAFQEAERYVIDAGSSESGVKLAEDGRTRLIPQPSDDPEDPLNWTWKRKHVILFVVSLVSLLPDYGSATGAVTLQVQAK